MRETNDLRITKLKEYLVDVVNSIEEMRKINVNALDKEISSYSLDKIPTNTIVENWIIDNGIKREVFYFRSRRGYSYDIIDNLLNIGFFEKFEQLIEKNNDEGNLPKIEGIEKISCLDCGTLRNAEKGTAEFNIQIEIQYRTGG